MPCLDVVVSGRVQGVGYRAFVRRRALDLGLSGTVRNRADGAVEVVAAGPRPELERLLEQLRDGPSGARISGIDVAWRDESPRLVGFVVTG